MFPGIPGHSLVGQDNFVLVVLNFVFEIYFLPLTIWSKICKVVRVILAYESRQTKPREMWEKSIKDDT
jgi:hypothetical protein